MAGTVNRKSQGDCTARTRCNASSHGLNLAFGEIKESMSHPLHAQANHKMKSLVVEDSEGVRESLSILLRNRGIQSMQAGNAATAMDHLMDGDFDFVVTDLDVPATGGLELIRWIRARSPSLPVIIVSGIPAGDGEKTGALSNTIVVQKTFEIEEVDAAISSVLRRLHG